MPALGEHGIGMVGGTNTGLDNVTDLSKKRVFCYHILLWDRNGHPLGF